MTRLHNIRTDIVRELGYVSIGELKVSHSLFGGVKSECEMHDIIKIRVKNLDTCNFSAMSQNIRVEFQKGLISDFDETL